MTSFPLAMSFARMGASSEVLVVDFFAYVWLPFAWQRALIEKESSSTGEALPAFSAWKACECWGLRKY